MEANKNQIAALANYQIKECDKYAYHVACLRREHIEKQKRYEDNWRVAIYDKRGYEDFKKNKHVLGYAEDHLIHDPTLLQKEEVKQTESDFKEEVAKAVKKGATKAKVVETLKASEKKRQDKK